MILGNLKIEDKWENLGTYSYLKDVIDLLESSNTENCPIPDYGIYVTCIGFDRLVPSSWIIYYPSRYKLFTDMHLALFEYFHFKSSDDAMQSVDLVLDKLSKLKVFI